MFRDPENPEAVGSIKLNSVQKTPKREMAARHLGQAQQALQMRAFEKMGAVQVIDVPIICVSYLGQMSDDEFTHRPDTQEKQVPDVFSLNQNHLNTEQ